MNNLKNKLKEFELDKLIHQINGFTALSRERELTESEAKERQLYRQEYIRRFGSNLRATLDNTDFEIAGEDDGGNS